MLLNKIDLLPYLKFVMEACIEHAKTVNLQIMIMQVSATTGEGMDEWYSWLRQQLADGLDQQGTA